MIPICIFISPFVLAIQFITHNKSSQVLLPLLSSFPLSPSFSRTIQMLNLPKFSHSTREFPIEFLALSSKLASYLFVSFFVCASLQILLIIYIPKLGNSLEKVDVDDTNVGQREN